MTVPLNSSYSFFSKMRIYTSKPQIFLIYKSKTLEPSNKWYSVRSMKQFLSRIPGRCTFLWDPVKFWWGSAFLFFEGFQPQNALSLFLFSMNHSFLIMSKISHDVNNFPLLGILSIKKILILLLRSMKLYTLMEHPVTSQKKTLTVFMLFFCK